MSNSNKKLDAQRKQVVSAHMASQSSAMATLRKQVAELAKLVAQQQGMLDAITLHLRELPNNDSFVACLVARMNDMMIAAEQKARDELNGVVTEARFKLVGDEDIAALPRDALLLKVAEVIVPATDDAAESTRIQISAREYNIDGNWAFFEIDDDILDRLEITGAQVIEAAGDTLPAVLHLTYEKVQREFTQAGTELAELENMADDADFEASLIESLIDIKPFTPEEEAILAGLSGTRSAGEHRYHETITGVMPAVGTEYVIVKAAARGAMAVYDHMTRQVTLSEAQMTFFSALLDKVFAAMPERKVVEFFVIHTPIAAEVAANDDTVLTTDHPDWTNDGDVVADVSVSASEAAAETVTDTAPAVQ